MMDKLKQDSREHRRWFFLNWMVRLPSFLPMTGGMPNLKTGERRGAAQCKLVCNTRPGVNGAIRTDASTEIE